MKSFKHRTSSILLKAWSDTWVGYQSPDVLSSLTFTKFEEHPVFLGEEQVVSLTAVQIKCIEYEKCLKC